NFRTGVCERALYAATDALIPLGQRSQVHIWLNQATFYLVTFTRCSRQRSQRSQTRVGRLRRCSIRLTTPDSVLLVKTGQFVLFGKRNHVSVAAPLGLEPELFANHAADPLGGDLPFVVHAVPVHEPAGNVFDR